MNTTKGTYFGVHDPDEGTMTYYIKSGFRTYYLKVIEDATFEVSANFVRTTEVPKEIKPKIKHHMKPYKITIEHWDEKETVEKNHSDITLDEYAAMLKSISIAAGWSEEQINEILC